MLGELQRRGLPVRAVERSMTLPGVESVHADLLELGQLRRAVEGASHVYLCAGLPYRADVWAAQFPTIMANTIDACAQAGARLAFFDNVYMYAPPLPVPFDESTPQNPASKKGRVRKAIADMLLQAHASGKVKALIGRSADFYGPHAKNSQLYIAFLERMLAGNAPRWMGKPDVPHTWAYTLDNGRALVALALDDSAYGEAWHLPAGEPITIEHIAAIFNQKLRAHLRVSFLPKAMIPLLRLVIRPVREATEMMYQFDAPYVISWAKFKARFPDFAVETYESGLAAMITSFSSA
jgi:nucleoside-diphosphate-sugar epimerase